MEIRFTSRKLAKLCSDDKAAAREWGLPNARKLAVRLAQLRACESLADMGVWPDARCHPLKGNRRGEFAVNLQGTWRLVFTPDDDPPALRAAGGLDPSQVRTVRILDVVDYHGD